jgi:type IV pilus assembly protein PilW
MSMSKNIHRASAARGFSLVELMIALLIGLIISIGVVQIFGATRATYQLDESLARAQENGRFALEFLNQDVRHAGYAGCKRDTSITVFNNLAYTAAAGLPIIGVSGAEYTAVPTGFNNTYSLTATPANTTSGWSPALAGVAGAFTGTPTGALPGTDVIALQRMVPNSWALAAPYITPDKVFIDPAFVSKVKDGDVMLVADCRNAVAFMVTNILPTGEISHTASATTNRCERWTGGLDTANAATAACAAPFDYDPESTTAMGKLETVVFFVANDPTADVANPRPTLFRRVMLATGGIVETTALVEGVENFQVMYGVDDVLPSDGAADRFVTANNVSDFAKVVSVQIGLLVYGVNATGTANDTEFDSDIHDVAGTSVVPAVNSRRKRRVFNTTIQLRNRSF